MSLTHVKQVRTDTPLTWTCGQCLVSLLPFHTCSELDTTTDTSLDESVVDNIQEILSSNCSNLKVMHLNTQAMTSTFNEFLLTMKTYPMDVALLSETWLRDQKELLDYVSTDGYATEFRHRVATKVGGVGAYIKENVAYRRRFDIEKTQPDLEHLWLELPGRNRHSKQLLGVIYRSDLLMTASHWLECINFDLIGRPDSLVTRYSNTLDMFGLEKIRTSRTLIDHIITNYPMRISAIDVIPTSIVSDHDAPFACINVRVNLYQPRYKYIRNMKTFDEQEFISDLDTLPLNIVY